MSVSNSRHSLLSFFSSKSLRKRVRSRIAALARTAKQRSLRMETLERRELMASDLGAVHHNSLIPTDVNGDFAVSPIDVLQVINAMNRQSNGTLSGSSDSMLDVNNDKQLTPLDALLIINKLKTGEGVGELAEVAGRVLNSAGVPITPSVGTDGVTEYRVAPGEAFTLQTRTRDLRDNPAGVFETTVDILYATKDAPTTELAQVQWTEANLFELPRNLSGGTFRLKYGSETTELITAASSISTTRTRMVEAISKLSFVGAATNITSNFETQPDSTISNTQGALIRIFFGGSLVRQNLPDAEVVDSNLTVTGAGPNLFQQVSSASAPSDPLALGSAITYPQNTLSNGGTYAYNQTKNSGVLETRAGVGLVLAGVGNFSNVFEPIVNEQVFLNIFDTAFRAATTPGSVEFTIGPTPSASNGIALVQDGAGRVLPDSLVIYPSLFRVVISSDLQAVNDTIALTQLTTPTTIVVGENDTFKEGTSFSIVSVTQPASGGVVTTVAGTTNNASAVSFEPNTSFVGPVAFTYVIENNLGARSTATVTVNGPNNPPVPLTPALNASEAGSAVSFANTQLFTPGNGETSQTVTLSSPQLSSGEGTVALDGNSVSYTPPSNDFFGPVVFTVNGTDNGAPSQVTTGTFTINVANVNDPPVVLGTQVSATEDTPKTILASELFSPGPANESAQTLTLASVTAVSDSSAGTIALVDGSAQFSPALNYSGPFIFTAVGRDNGTSDTDSVLSTFTITVAEVNDDPIAGADTGVANRFTVPRIASQPANLEVMRNDSSGDTGQTISVTAITQPGSGTVAIGPNGSVVIYTPAADTPVGSVQSFTYTITDTGSPAKTATASVEVFIDPPTRPFAVDDTAQVAQNGSQIVIDVLLNDFKNADPVVKQLLSPLGTLNPSNAGTLVILDNGTASDRSDDKIGFTPTAGFTGITTFTYQMTDTGSESAASTATVTISVGEQNDPPVLRTATVAGIEDTPQTILASTLFSPGPSDESAQTLAFITGTMAVTGQTGGTIEISNGNVVFTPTLNFNGPFTFVAVVQDNGTTNSVADPKTATATITINVAAVNDAPTALATTNLTTAEEAALTINASALFSPGPSDESAQTMTVTNVSAVSATGGTIVLSNGSALFTPSTNFVGAFSFVATVQDNGSPAATSQASTFTINVSAVNDAPGPVAATRSGNATIPITIDLTAELAQASRGGGTDEATQTVRVNRVIPITGTGATRGTVTLNANGTINYVAPAGFSGPDSFDYEIIDDGTTNGAADPKTGIARVTVNVAAFVPSSVSGQVWIDDDRDSVKDSDELRLGGVELILTGRAIGATSDITPIRQTTRTDGTYTFDGLSPGTYVVTFTSPSKLVDSPAPNSITISVVAPGGTNSVHDFSVYGLEASFSNALDNLESNYYLRNGQEWRYRGFTALVQSNGSSAWVAHHGGFEGIQSESVRMASDGVYLTVVQANSTVVETKIPRNMYLSCGDSNGNTLVRILAMPSQLSFAPVITTASVVEGEGNASNVDRVFSQMGR